MGVGVKFGKLPWLVIRIISEGQAEQGGVTVGHKITHVDGCGVAMHNSQEIRRVLMAGGDHTVTFNMNPFNITRLDLSDTLLTKQYMTPLLYLFKHRFTDLTYLNMSDSDLYSVFPTLAKQLPTTLDIIYLWAKEPLTEEQRHELRQQVSKHLPTTTLCLLKKDRAVVDAVDAVLTGQHKLELGLKLRGRRSGLIGLVQTAAQRMAKWSDREFTTVKIINLANNGLNDGACNVLLPHIAKCSSLEEMYMYENSLGTDTAMQLCKLLINKEQWPALVKLDMTNNKELTDEDNAALHWTWKRKSGRTENGLSASTNIDSRFWESHFGKRLVKKTQAGDMKHIDFLIKIADINWTYSFNQTALMWAAKEGNTEVAEKLMAANINPHLTTEGALEAAHNGLAAADWARNNGHADLAEEITTYANSFKYEHGGLLHTNRSWGWNEVQEITTQANRCRWVALQVPWYEPLTVEACKEGARVRVVKDCEDRDGAELWAGLRGRIWRDVWDRFDYVFVEFDGMGDSKAIKKENLGTKLEVEIVPEVKPWYEQKWQGATTSEGTDWVRRATEPAKPWYDQEWSAVMELRRVRAEPLLEAAKNGNTETVKSVIAEGIVIHDNEALSTALIWSVRKGNTEVAALLIAGDLINDNKALCTALVWSAIEGNTEVAELLMSANVNPHFRATGINGQLVEFSLRDIDGRTASDVARRKGHTKLATTISTYTASWTEEGTLWNWNQIQSRTEETNWDVWNAYQVPWTAVQTRSWNDQEWWPILVITNKGLMVALGNLVIVVKNAGSPEVNGTYTCSSERYRGKRKWVSENGKKIFWYGGGWSIHGAYVCSADTDAPPQEGWQQGRRTRTPHRRAGKLPVPTLPVPTVTWL